MITALQKSQSSYIDPPLKRREKGFYDHSSSELKPIALVIK